MKKTLFYTVVGALLLTGCANNTPPPTVHIDPSAVQAYESRVYSGNTVPATQRQQMPQNVDIPLNQSDNQPKMNTRANMPVVLMPSVGFGYHRGYWY